jgi:hypothetical protein
MNKAYMNQVKMIAKVIKAAECCDQGRVSENESYCKIDNSEDSFLELHDVICVAAGNKPLAALDFSTLGKSKLKKTNIQLKNFAIKYANNNNVEMLHNKKTGGMYLKTIFFLPENYDNALKLMYVLWYGSKLKMTGVELQIAIGLLLGYSNANISHFIRIRYNFDKAKKVPIAKVTNALKKMKITLEDLQKDHKIVHLKDIPSLTKKS